MMLNRMTDFLGGIAKRQAEVTGAYEGAMAWAEIVTQGMIEGTKVATQMGWRPVDAVIAGDLVLTFDGGLQRVKAVTRRTLWAGMGACPEALWPLEVPAGALGNEAAYRVLPDQVIMIESDLAERIYGDPFACIPAMALEGFRGIRRVAPEGPIVVVTLQFEEEQVVFDSTGALFHFPPESDLVGGCLGEEESVYNPLSYEAATALVDSMAAEDAGDVVILRTPAMEPAYAA